MDWIHRVPQKDIHFSLSVSGIGLVFGVASATFIQFLKKISLSVLDVLLSSKPSLLISFETEEKDVTISNISKKFFI